jgi:DNA replication protein DnaC
MHGLAQAVTDLIEQGAPAFEVAIPILSQLLKAELAEREVRSIAYHMKAARFPAYKDLAGFDFAASEVNEATVRTLHRGPRQRSRTDGDSLARSSTGRRTSC